MNVDRLEMLVVIDGHTFVKVIGEDNIYSEEYGQYILNSSHANTFHELIAVASNWLEKQQ
jgi:hypothetical protein